MVSTYHVGPSSISIIFFCTIVLFDIDFNHLGYVYHIHYDFFQVMRGLSMFRGSFDMSVEIKCFPECFMSPLILVLILILHL